MALWQGPILSALSHRDKTKVSLLICLAFFKLRRVRTHV
jgi:hypothetical protein